MASDEELVTACCVVEHLMYGGTGALAEMWEHTKTYQLTGPRPTSRYTAEVLRLAAKVQTEMWGAPVTTSEAVAYRAERRTFYAELIRQGPPPGG